MGAVATVMRVGAEYPDLPRGGDHVRPGATAVAAPAAR